MKKNILLLIIIVLFAGKANSDDMWTPFLTNNSDTDYIYDIVTEGSTLWAATNGGVVKWNTMTGTSTIFPLEYVPHLGNSILCAAIDWNGVKWFGGNGRIYIYNDTTWVSFAGESEFTRNLLLNGSVGSIAVDSVNKRVIFTILKENIVLLSWNFYDGGKWEVLFSIKGDTFWPALKSIAVDTVNPWNIWGTASYGGYLLFFEKTDQGYAITKGVAGSTNVYATSFAIDCDNNIWMTAIESPNIAFYNRYKETIITYSSDITGAIGSFYRQGRVVIDHNWVKWFGGNESLVRYDGKSWTAYPYIKKTESDLLSALATDERGNVWIGRNGYGLYRFHPPVTGVDEEVALPQALKIIGNSPNPFNPATTISFSLSARSETELSIYSATGQRIRTLVSGNQTAGSHSVIWDGLDDSGKPVSSGVYLSRLTAEKYTVTGKMLLVR
jgi:hypothetical protein